MKKNSKKISSLLVGAAFAGLMAGTTTLASCGGDTKAATEKNGCNGHAAKKEANGCNGPNGCNGHDAKKEANGCNGPNGCNAAKKTPEKKS